MPYSLRRFSFKAMGSPCELQFYDDSRVQARKRARELIQESQRLERKYSRYLEDSFLSQINRSAGASAGITLDEETRKLFDHAATCYHLSDGLFDVTAGILRNVWNFRLPQLPDPARLSALLAVIGFDKLRWQHQTLFLAAGMEVDFGGIVKEYAADAVSRLARELGIAHGLVNLGGDFSVIGSKPDGSPWPVGIANPRQPKAMMARIDLLDGGLASSGDYARGFVLDGKRYSHILNPKTGWPCSGLRAVSVAANLCTVAGSFATIAMLKEEQDALNWLEESGLPYVYMDSSEEIKGPALQTAAPDEY